MTLSEILHYLHLGGATLAILLLTSFLALTVAVERLIALWGVSDRSRTLGDTVSRHLLRGDLMAARTAAERSDAVVADIYLAGFDRLERLRGLKNATGDGFDAAVQRERLSVGLRLKKNLWVLGTIGAVTPFVGLFGTVAGIMRSFKDLGVDVSGGGSGGSAAVMTGISEALIATAVGILVAVMAVVFYNYFQARLARLNVELSLMADEFIELVKERNPSTYPATSPALSDGDAARSTVEGAPA